MDELNDEKRQKDQPIYTDELGVGIRTRVTKFIGEDGQQPVSFIFPIGIPAYPLFSGPGKKK